jgi:N-acetylglutamate synthase-like GNAT family acetyltransferase
MKTRKANVSDISLIQSIAEAAWRPTYGEILSEEQCVYMLNWMYNTQKLKEQINGNIQFIILENQDSKAIGYASFEKTEEESGKLHKIYIHPDFKQKGGGSVLLYEIMKIAHSMNVKVLELNVNRYNSAVEFYLKKGFTIKEEIDLDVGNGFFMNDYVMRYEL